MIISNTHKFVYVANPKTASTSMAGALVSYNQVPNPSNNKTFRHASQALVSSILTNHNIAHNFSDYYEFVFVRHPYTRILSLHKTHKNLHPRYAVKGNMSEALAKAKSGTVDKFLDKYEMVLAGEKPDDITSYSQLAYTSEPFTSNIHIFKFENLQTAWTQIKSDIGVDFGLLPHLNRDVYQASADMLLPHQKDRIFELFREEFYQFEYDR